VVSPLQVFQRKCILLTTWGIIMNDIMSSFLKADRPTWFMAAGPISPFVQNNIQGNTASQHSKRLIATQILRYTRKCVYNLMTRPLRFNILYALSRRIHEHGHDLPSQWFLLTSMLWSVGTWKLLCYGWALLWLKRLHSLADVVNKINLFLQCFAVTQSMPVIQAGISLLSNES
jgi:hypothetical protein